MKAEQSPDNPDKQTITHKLIKCGEIAGDTVGAGGRDGEESTAVDAAGERTH